MKPYSGRISIPVDFISITAPQTLPTYTRGILCGVAGTVNVTMKNGHVITGLPLVAGVNPGEFASVQSGGTATGLWAIV